MRAFDGGVPPKDNVTTVQVTVNRNLFCPAWRNDNDLVEILETSDVASPVFTVSASDDDTQVNNCDHGHLFHQSECRGSVKVLFLQYKKELVG